MQVFCTITANSGQRVPLVLEDTPLTPTELRQKVSEVTSIPLTNLRLIFRGRMIKDDDDVTDVVAEFKLENESVLHCMGKPQTATAAAAAVQDTTRVANPTIVPPLSSNSSATAPAASAPRPSSNGDRLTKALERLSQNNPQSVYATATATLEKVLNNIVQNPMEEKYRQVKRQNAAFRKRLGGLVGGHDCMLATGFVVEFNGGEEVYKLHASAESWNALVACQKQVSQAASRAKDPPRAPPRQHLSSTEANAIRNNAGLVQSVFQDPSFMQYLQQNRDRFGGANPDVDGLSSEIFRRLLHNSQHPSLTPEQRERFTQLANDPERYSQWSRMIGGPNARENAQRFMETGQVPEMPAAPPPENNDEGQTEEEMIAEAIRRSLQDQ